MTQLILISFFSPVFYSFEFLSFCIFMISTIVLFGYLSYFTFLSKKQFLYDLPKNWKVSFIPFKNNKNFIFSNVFFFTDLHFFDFETNIIFLKIILISSFFFFLYFLFFKMKEVLFCLFIIEIFTLLFLILFKIFYFLAIFIFFCSLFYCLCNLFLLKKTISRTSFSCLSKLSRFCFEMDHICIYFFFKGEEPRPIWIFSQALTLFFLFIYLPIYISIIITYIINDFFFFHQLNYFNLIVNILFFSWFIKLFGFSFILFKWFFDIIEFSFKNYNKAPNIFIISKILNVFLKIYSKFRKKVLSLKIRVYLKKNA